MPNILADLTARHLATPITDLSAISPELPIAFQLQHASELFLNPATEAEAITLAAYAVSLWRANHGVESWPTWH